MRNFIQSGQTIGLAAPYTLASGDGALVGTLFGVAASSAAAGTPVELATLGVFDLSCLAADTLAAGAIVYWDNANRRCTSTATGNRIIGSAIAAKAAAETTCRVRLDGVTR